MHEHHIIVCSSLVLLGSCTPFVTDFLDCNKSGVCPDGFACQDGNCVNIEEYCPGRCFIGGACIEGGDVNDSNVCQICDPLQNNVGWSNNDGVECDDGVFCNGEDSCLDGMCSVSNGDPCPDDGNFCNGEERCSESGCIAVNVPCSTTEACFESDDSCCEPGTEPSCSDTLDVITTDSCGHEVIQSDCSDEDESCVDAECYVMFDELWMSTFDGNTTSLLWLDLNRDGYTDLIEALRNRPLRVFINDEGTLPTEPTWTAPSSPVDTTMINALDPADLDNDGAIDAVAVARGTMGSGDRFHLNYIFAITEGTIDTASPIWTSADEQNTIRLTWGDVDGDGDLDLAEGNVWGPDRVYLNEEGVLCTTPTWESEEALMTSTIIWGDVNNDGGLDLVVVNEANGPIQLYLNDGSGGLPTSPSWSSETTEVIESQGSLGDMDGDGDLDLVVSPGRVYAYDSSHDAYELHLTSEVIAANTWLDVDDDGDLDLVAIDAMNVMLNDGSGPTERSPVRALARSEGAGLGVSLTAADLDDDGDLDIIRGSWSAAIQIFVNNRY